MKSAQTNFSAAQREFGNSFRKDLDTELHRYLDLSSHDPREVLGIGTATRVDELEIHWPAPSKSIDKFNNLAPNRYVHIVEGKGIS